MLKKRPLLKAAAAGGSAYLARKKRAQSANGGAGEASAPPQVENRSASEGGLSNDAIDQLNSLAQLHDQGILTDQEFDEQKQKVLRP